MSPLWQVRDELTPAGWGQELGPWLAAAQWETVTGPQAEGLGPWKNREALGRDFSGFCSFVSFVQNKKDRVLGRMTSTVHKGIEEQ